MGKRADVVVWDGDWMDPMARPALVLIDGAEVYRREGGVETIAPRA